MQPGARTRTLEPGDYIYFESNTWLGPFKAYRSFPIALGQPPTEMKELFDFTLQLAKDVAATLKPGNSTADIVRLGERIASAGLSCNGPLCFGPTTGGWQMVCEERFKGYPPTAEVQYEPGMWMQVGPHMANSDHSRAAIIGDIVLVGEQAGQTQGKHGLRYVVVD